MNRWAKIGLLCASFASIPLLMAPRNGSGTYQLPAGNPVVSGTVISSTTHNTTMSDVATALTGSLAKDGQTTPTANLPMGSFRHTSVGNPTLRNQYGTVDNIQDGDYLTLTAVAGTNTVTGSLAPSISAYVAGMQVILIPANANTGATTLNLNSVGALDVQKYTSAGQVNVAANDLRAGIPALLLLDTGGDDWILLNPYSGSLGDVTIGTLTATTINASSTVTGGNIDTPGAVTAASVAVSGAGATSIFSVNDTGGASNKKLGKLVHQSNQLQLQACTDGGGFCTGAVNIAHTGSTIDLTNITGTAVQANGSAILTAANGFANPTATIGLSTVNGSAATAMPSDGAPALSQSITPTWSAQHKFSKSGGATDAAILISATPFPFWSVDESTASANNRFWDFGAQSEQLTFRIINDANSVTANWLTVDRTGTTVDKVAFPTDNASGNLQVGPAPSGGVINFARMHVTSASSSVAAAQFTNAGGTGPVVAIYNKDTTGDNGFMYFGTEGTITQRGSITYNRAGGLVAYNTTSDERLKKNFKPAPSARSVIDCVQIESFDWKETGAHVAHGVVAQHLEKCAPYSVSKGDVWQVDKSTLIPAMIKYMQEQDARIQRLESQVRRIH